MTQQQVKVKKSVRPTARPTEQDDADDRRTPSGQPMNR